MLVFPVSFLRARKSLFWSNWLKKGKTTKKLLNLQKWHQKEQNFLEREIIFPQLNPLEARYPVVKTLELSFRLKALLFHLKLRRRLKHCAIFQKWNFKIFERYVGCSFHNHAGSFSLKTKKKLHPKP